MKKIKKMGGEPIRWKLHHFEHSIVKTNSSDPSRSKWKFN